MRFFDILTDQGDILRAGFQGSTQMLTLSLRETLKVGLDTENISARVPFAQLGSILDPSEDEIGFDLFVVFASEICLE